MTVVAVSDAPLGASLDVRYEAPAGAEGAGFGNGTRLGGPPYSWTASTADPKPGKWIATLRQPGCEGERGVVSLPITVAKAHVAASTAPPREGLWPSRRAWTRDLEDLYSAWVERLFDAPDDAQPSYAALHEVLRDREKNFLHDYLGTAEDSGKKAPVIRPDCADLPYFLRAYFAYKLKLPFGLAECTRGGGGAPPSCKGLVTNEDHDDRADAKREAGATGVFGAFLRGTLADRAHSGSARTPFEDESSDYYPVRLSWETLRPGTVYADPYGHILVIAKRVPQTAERAGILYAVDGQPDGTVARKRFWRGNFLYATERELGGPGFKRFRPVVRHGGRLYRADDAFITKSADYGDLSRDAAKLDRDGFYDAMDDILSPRPLDPERALLGTIDALEEQVKTRVKSVDNGRKWLETARAPASMPDGPEIFETSGAWEDFATPSRDLRLLIAIDVVRGFPARAGRRPERFAASRASVTGPTAATASAGTPTGPGALQANLEAILARELKTRTVTYTRSDGSPFTLALADVVARADALETAYNPNACVESRWGAPAGSDELAPCRANAPREQRTRMEAFRPWFHERRRPPRK